MSYYKNFIIYTDQEGGTFAWKEASEQDWEDLKRDGYMLDCGIDREIISPAYAAFVECIEDIDFVLEKIGQNRRLPDSKERG